MAHGKAFHNFDAEYVNYLRKKKNVLVNNPCYNLQLLSSIFHTFQTSIAWTVHLKALDRCFRTLLKLLILVYFPYLYKF